MAKGKQLSFPITNVEWEIRYNEEVERRERAEDTLDDIQEAIDRLLCKYYGHADTTDHGECKRCWEKV
ncbi:hypothetical protein LCGC14_0311090 [marine sediment metagenome]|uniref:Uncharacterized protein n=1 Tax=marine sediment metagenome TaxID=412755 RepID=A0A0F9W9G4_9ZZZZ